VRLLSCIRKIQSAILRIENLNMADDKKVPLLAEQPKEPPPTYEAAAIQHGALPARTGPSKPLPRGPFPLDIPVLNQLRGQRVILASASPRRKQILAPVFPPYFPHADLTN
jgi:hypothetical protein